MEKYILVFPEDDEDPDNYVTGFTYMPEFEQYAVDLTEDISKAKIFTSKVEAESAIFYINHVLSEGFNVAEIHRVQ